MKAFRASVLSVLICAAFSGPVSAQVCGDASGDNAINILDLVIMLEYFSGNPVPINLTNADCDGVSGVTVSDFAALCMKGFNGLPLDCTPSGAYSFAGASNDTIYVPRLANIPDGVDKVNLLVFGSFSTATNGIFVPFKKQGAGASSNFNLDRVYSTNLGIGTGLNTTTNESGLVLGDWDNPTFIYGDKNLFVLSYERTAPGIGNVFPEAFDMITPLRQAITRNDDLLVPVIQYYDVSSVEGGLELSATDFHFHSLAYNESLDTFRLDISQGLYGVGFTITTSVPWVTADQYSGVTPATVTFLADGTGLGIGDFSGAIRVSYADVSNLPVDSVSVALTVHPLGDVTYPAGDLNCDQKVNILDLTNFVDYIFRGGLRPFPCAK